MVVSKLICKTSHLYLQRGLSGSQDKLLVLQSPTAPSAALLSIQEQVFASFLLFSISERVSLLFRDFFANGAWSRDSKEKW